MLYAALKASHLLAVVAWVGGMFFVLVCLRPASLVLPAPERVRLLHAALGRFLAVVAWSAAVALATGAAMTALAWQAAVRAGLAFNVPLDWLVMSGAFVGMALVFLHVRLALFPRVGAAMAQGLWQPAAVALGRIRAEVLVNLVLGVFVVVVMRLGAAA
jgi:uncharacterized membrane protein